MSLALETLVVPFFWLAGQAFGVLTHYWMVTVAAIAGMAGSVLVQYFFFEPEPWRVRHFLVFTPLSVSIVILLLGTLFGKDSGWFSAGDWLVHTVWVLVIVQILVSVWTVWAMKGYRWFTVFATALQLWFGLGCAFVSGMSITGDWL